MGNNISSEGNLIFELNECEIIGNNEIIYLMFSIIDEFKRKLSFLCVKR